jgi:hypothetical protein
VETNGESTWQQILNAVGIQQFQELFEF